MDFIDSFDGTRIAVMQAGAVPDRDDSSGTPRAVLLLHGFASDHVDNWVKPGIVDALTGAGRVVIAPDARGHGASDKPHGIEAYSGEVPDVPEVPDIPEVMVRDAQAVLDDRGIGSVAVVGYSMGALVGARLTAADARVRALVLAGAGGSLRRDSTDSGDGGLAAALLVDDPGRITHPVGRAFRDFADRSGADRLALAAIERSTSLRSDVQFDAITVPTLVLIGDRDRSVGSPREVAARIRGAQLRTVAGDHLSAPNDPAFSRAILEFLAQADGVARSVTRDRQRRR